MLPSHPRMAILSYMVRLVNMDEGNSNVKIIINVIMNEMFARLYNQLNPQQKEAVDTLEGPLMVVAGPGTGKTQVLTLRIANVILQGKAKPEEVLALTFTENAAANMRRRLFEILGSRAYFVNIATFHGFCNEVIQQNPEDFAFVQAQDIYRAGTNVSEVEQTQLLENIIRKGQFERFNLYNPYINYIALINKAIGDLKREGVGPNEYNLLIQKAEDELAARDDLYHAKGRYKGQIKSVYKKAQERIEKNKEFCEVYRHYQEELTSLGDYDYNDMIMYTLRALRENKILRERLRGAYKYILIDEHQDANSAQNKVVELIGGEDPAPNIFVVGDEKQAIFRFQGASLANIMYFKNKFPSCKVVTLQKNYRSHQKIIDAAQSVISNNEGRIANYIVGIDDSLTAAHGSAGRKIELYEPETPELELYMIKEKIKELEAEGVARSEIAVLYRENREGDAISDVLSKEGILHVVESSRNIFDDAAIKNFIALVIFAARRDLTSGALRRQECDAELINLLLIDFLEIPASDVYKLASLRAERRKPKNIFWVMSDVKLMQENNIESCDKIFEFSQNISKWISAAQSKNAAQAFEQIARESGFLEYIASKNSFDYIAKFNTIFSELKNLTQSKKNFTLADFTQHVALLGRFGIALKQKSLRLPADAVRLMTVHKAKGLEFDYVILCGCLDARWGGRKKPDVLGLLDIYGEGGGTDASAIEDNRRLFYVALTRARKGVFISAPLYAGDGREQIRSRFIGEIKPELVERGDVSRYDKGIAATAHFFISEARPSEPGVSDKKFLQALFLKRGLSATALNNYLVCPWRYFYRNLVRLPEAQQSYLMYGNAVHAALKEFFDWPDRSKEHLFLKFTRALNAQPFLEHEALRYKGRGEKALSAYFDNYDLGSSMAGIKTINEFTVGNIMLDRNIRLTGKIDKIELDFGGGVNVVDYKTGRAKSRNALAGIGKNAAGNERRQLVFYKLLLDRLPDSKYRMTSGEIDFVEPDKKSGKFRKEKFVISSEDTSALESQIRQSADEILSLSFWNKRCDDARCYYCSLREMTQKRTPR